MTKATFEMALNPQPAPPRDTPVTDGYDWDSFELVLSVEQTKQFFTLYDSLRGFNDREAQRLLTCPRLCFAGSKDIQTYSERWGGVEVDMTTPLITHSDELQRSGWDVQLLSGLDHTSAMQPANVLPIIRPWLLSARMS